jgi:hypothetical protein
MKTNEKISHAEFLKQEIMERYGLREDQVKLELTVSTIDLELGREILNDFNTRFPNNRDILLEENQPCGSVYSNSIHSVSVHRKDGNYGTYIVGEDDEQ